MWHRFVVRGYGSVCVPTLGGHSVKLVRTFAPITSSWLQYFASLIKGSPPQVRAHGCWLRLLGTGALVFTCAAGLAHSTTTPSSWGNRKAVRVGNPCHVVVCPHSRHL